VIDLDTSSGPRRNAIVFSGGGIFFATHVGVMKEMSGWTMAGENFLAQFPVLVGTSAGALYAALYASGLTPAQIALYARIFADPAIGPKLFDPNFAGAAAALVRHDPGYALGAVRGLAIQTLLETVFSREVHGQLKAFSADSDEQHQRQIRELLVRKWSERRGRRRDATYYADQLTFTDCTKALFIISVNAYNGQKTVFAVRPHQGDWDRERQEDDELYQRNGPPYLNAPQSSDLPSGGDYANLEFRRFEHRVYRGYDTELYGAQLPLALAVRASISIPVIFEPLRLRRWHKPGTRDEQEDLFIDGGVEDNFSLSVAVEPLLGNADKVLGIALGNLGYRIPDAAAAASIVALLSKTTSYMGDALIDLGAMRTELAGHRVAVVDAMASVRGRLTDTNRIGELIDDGAEIARDFWTVINAGRPYPGPTAVVDPATAFARDPQAVYLSAAARGVAPPTKPRVLETRLALRDVFRVPLLSLALEWRFVYGLIALIALGVTSMLFVLVSVVEQALAGDLLNAVGGLLTSLLIGLVAITVGIVLVRLFAFALWRAGAHTVRDRAPARVEQPVTVPPQ